MARTTVEQVLALLGVNYDTSSNPDLQQFIDMAAMFIDRVEACAAAKGITLTEEELEMLERIWACHLYTKMDPLYSSKSTLSASGSFVQGKEAERYKDMAIMMDPSGCVKSLSSSSSARMLWLGKPPSEQIDAADRD